MFYKVCQVSRQGGEQLSFYFCQEFPHNERGVCRRIVMVQQPVSIQPLECVDITLWQSNAITNIVDSLSSVL
jgi:hypothetical protein